jgi:hypothetical protein
MQQEFNDQLKQLINHSEEPIKKYTANNLSMDDLQHPLQNCALLHSQKPDFHG